MDQPEILIPALLVVGTKLCFPLSPKQKPLLSQAEDLGLRFDWEKWISLKGDTGQEYKSLYADTQFKDVSVEQVVTMDNEQMDNYLRYMSHLIHTKSKLVITGPLRGSY